MAASSEYSWLKKPLSRTKYHEKATAKALRAFRIGAAAILPILGLPLQGCRAPETRPIQTIEFTKVPAADEGGPDKVGSIAGRVVGPHADLQIVLYAKSGTWWVQPFADKPFTAIQADSTWSSPTHLGTEYAALLVQHGYIPAPTLAVLPSSAKGVVAVAMAKGGPGLPEVAKDVHFSGYDWKVRTIASTRGGRLNLYDPSNVWTDQSGFLHLRISKDSAGKWNCAEVNLTRSLGYGTYRFTVQDSSQLQPSDVLSMFTWDDEGAMDPNHREFAIELTRWGDATSKNAQYTVQPFYVPANVARFDVPRGRLIYSVRWEQGKLLFRTTQPKSGMAQRVVYEHTFTSGVPTPGNETVHADLYFFGRVNLVEVRPAEAVIEKFEYLP